MIMMSMKEKIESILLWSQKYTKTDMTYLAREGSWLTLAKIIGIAASFITSVAFANLLPESTYGTYRYVLSMMMLLIIPTLIGIDSALVRTVAKGNEHTFFRALKAKVSWGLLGSVGALALSSYYFVQGDTTLGIAFLVAALFIPIMDPSNLYLAYLSGKKNFKEQTQYLLVIRTLTTLAIVGTVFCTQNVLIILSVYFGSYTILRLFFLYVVSKKVDRETTSDPDTVSFGMHLTALNMPTTISKTLDSILIFHVLGGAALAGYALARLPLKQGQNTLRSIHTLALPSFSMREKKEVTMTLPQKILKSYIIIVPIVVLYWFSAELIFKTIYPQYTDFVFLSQILTLQLLFLPISLISTALTAFGEKKKLYIYSLITSLTRTVLFFVLIPLYGLMGAAASLIGTAFIGSCILLCLFMVQKTKPHSI